MRILFRWIILVLIAISSLTLVTIAIPRHFMPSSTIHFWAVDGLGAYRYYYDFRTESLHLDEQWHPNAQIAPNGEVAVILNRGIRTVYIDTIDADGTRESFGEFPVDIIDLEANWSLDSEAIYMAGRTENGITAYRFEIATRELTPIVEFEDIQADNFTFGYEADTNLLFTVFINFTSTSFFKLYDMETGEQWTIEVDSFLIPLEDWKEYLTLTSPQSGNADESDKQELQRISLTGDSKVILPLPDEGEVVSIDFMRNDENLLVTTIDPNGSYVLDLETETYTQIATELALIMWLYSPDETMILALDYGFFQGGGTGVWYMLDLETYEVHYLMTRYDGNVLRNQGNMVLSPDNQVLAVLANDFRDSADLEIISIETGEVLHHFRLPQNRLGSVSSNLGVLMEWYEP